MSEQDNYVIALFGIQTFELRVLERIFSISAARPHAYSIAGRENLQSADIVLVDKTNEDELSAYETFVARHTNVPTVAISKDAKASGDYTVRRPFTASRMLSVLDEVVMKELGRDGNGSAGATGPEEDLPCASRDSGDSDPGEGPDDGAAVVAVSLQGCKALVVDDSLPVRKQVGAALKKAGMPADFAETGESALALMAENAYDIIFLDVVLPGIDGYDVCKSIKRDKDKKHIPVVMLTGRSSPFDKVKGKLSGCDTYLTKPVSLKEFTSTLNKCLNESAAGQPSTKAS